jgi:MSHA pilin protein MshC
MNCQKKTFLNNRAFTLIEVVAVLVVLGIVAAVAVSRGFNMDADKISDLEKVKSHLRYAQSKSMADNAVNWGIQFSGATYFLFRDMDNNGLVAANEKVVLPGEPSTDAALATLTATGVVSFNWWGAPYSDVGCTAAFTSGTFALGSTSISITSVTGFIP